MQGMHRHSRSACSRPAGKTNPTRARLRHLQRPRPDRGRHRRRPEGSRRRAGGDVHRPRLRRLRHCRDPCAGLLRRFRQARRAGIAAPRPVSQGLCRQDACARISACGALPPAPGKPGRRPPPNKNKRKHHALAQIHRRRQDILGHRRGRARDRRQLAIRSANGSAGRSPTRSRTSRSSCRWSRAPSIASASTTLEHLKEAADKRRHGAERARPARDRLPRRRTR